MKQPKKLTRQQKEAVSAAGLVWQNWSLVRETDFYLYIVNRQTGTERRIDRYGRIIKEN